MTLSDHRLSQMTTAPPIVVAPPAKLRLLAIQAIVPDLLAGAIMGTDGNKIRELRAKYGNVVSLSSRCRFDANGTRNPFHMRTVTAKTAGDMQTFSMWQNIAELIGQSHLLMNVVSTSYMCTPHHFEFLVPTYEMEAVCGLQCERLQYGLVPAIGRQLHEKGWGRIHAEVHPAGPHGSAAGFTLVLLNAESLNGIAYAAGMFATWMANRLSDGPQSPCGNDVDHLTGTRYFVNVATLYGLNDAAIITAKPCVPKNKGWKKEEKTTTPVVESNAASTTTAAAVNTSKPTQQHLPSAPPPSPALLPNTTNGVGSNAVPLLSTPMVQKQPVYSGAWLMPLGGQGAPIYATNVYGVPGQLYLIPPPHSTAVSTLAANTTSPPTTVSRSHTPLPTDPAVVHIGPIHRRIRTRLCVGLPSSENRSNETPSQQLAAMPLLAPVLNTAYEGRVESPSREGIPTVPA